MREFYTFVLLACAFWIGRLSKRLPDKDRPARVAVLAVEWCENCERSVNVTVKGACCSCGSMSCLRLPRMAQRRAGSERRARSMKPSMLRQA